MNTAQTCGSRKAAADKNCSEWLALVFIVFTFVFGVGFVIITLIKPFHFLAAIAKGLEHLCNLTETGCWDFSYIEGEKIANRKFLFHYFHFCFLSKLQHI